MYLVKDPIVYNYINDISQFSFSNIGKQVLIDDKSYQLTAIGVEIFLKGGPVCYLNPKNAIVEDGNGDWTNINF